MAAVDQYKDRGVIDWSKIARASMDGDEEATVLLLLRDVIRDSVENKLQWNVNAYGMAWTGEGEDTEFLVYDAPGSVLEALREAGFEVVRARG